MRKLGCLVTTSTLIAWAEWATWRASRELLPPTAVDPRSVVAGECVVVLGNPIPAVQRYRVRVAVRSTDPLTATFIFSGGAVRTEISEAQMMADYAVEGLGIPTERVVIEDQSRTTVENIGNSLPFVGNSPAIKIASDTFHARRARRILHDQSPHLAQRLVRTRDYIPLEFVFLHVFSVAFELYRQHRFRRST